MIFLLFVESLCALLSGCGAAISAAVHQINEAVEQLSFDSHPAA
jgi:hypothetical protein